MLSDKIDYEILGLLLTGYRSQWQRFGLLPENAFDRPYCSAIFAVLVDVYGERDAKGWYSGGDGIDEPIPLQEFLDALLFAGMIGEEEIEMQYRGEDVLIPQVSETFCRGLIAGLTFDIFADLDIGRDLFVLLPEQETMPYKEIKSRMLEAGYEESVLIDKLREWRTEGVANMRVEEGASFWQLAPVNREDLGFTDV